MKTQKHIRALGVFVLLALTCAGCGGATESKTQAQAPAPAAQEPERPIDLDLTAMSGTIVYSQVYDMVSQPEAYMGQKVRMRGEFSYYQDPETLKEYFAVVIADATACCAQGIEFVLTGEHHYPQDYPELYSEVTVTGIFDEYYENGYPYIQLIDARLE